MIDFKAYVLSALTGIIVKTQNGDKKEWYLDAYKKFDNRVIKRIDENKE